MTLRYNCIFYTVFIWVGLFLCRSEMHVPSVSIRFALILEAYFRGNNALLAELFKEVEALQSLRALYDHVEALSPASVSAMLTCSNLSVIYISTIMWSNTPAGILFMHTINTVIAQKFCPSNQASYKSFLAVFIICALAPSVNWLIEKGGAEAADEIELVAEKVVCSCSDFYMQEDRNSLSLYRKNANLLILCYHIQ